MSLSLLDRCTSSACTRALPRHSAPPPMADPGPLYRLRCAAQDARRELFACRTSRELPAKREAAVLAREAADAAARHASDVRLSADPEERAHSAEARELATQAGDDAADAEMLVAALERRRARS